MSQRKVSRPLLAGLLCAGSFGAAFADTMPPVQLRTSFTGPSRCLDIVNDGTNNRLAMADCGRYSGQQWLMSYSDAWHFRLRTAFTGPSKCLDVVNDGTNNRLVMAACGNFSGQSWSLEPTAGSNGVHLRSAFTGPGKCLDIVNDGNNNHVQMAACGNYSGQNWMGIPH